MAAKSGSQTLLRKFIIESLKECNEKPSVVHSPLSVVRSRSTCATQTTDNGQLTTDALNRELSGFEQFLDVGEKLLCV